MNKRILFICGLIFLILACNLPASASTPTPNLLATLSASTPLSVSTDASVPSTFSPSTGPTGRIVFTCQIYKDQTSEQICIMNADGSDYRRLTTEDDMRHLYPSISPDGGSVVYSAFNKQSKHYEIYELDLSTGENKALTYALGDLNAPEISPDGKTIAFTRFFNDPDKPSTWLMDRNGTNLRQVSAVAAWDPTWSPDGGQILFASYINDLSQLFIINLDGTGLHQVSDLPDLRGRSDWSPENLIVTYSGKPWKRELFVMNVDGSAPHQISPSGGNSQGPSFSPDGQWIAFTAYFDKYGDAFGCEIYIIRAGGTDLRRLTNNDYCDYQPRWGP
jgi:TolB protein